MYMELLLRDERKEGRREAGKMINLLNEKLLKEGRIEDLKKSTTDEAYQESLLKEYGLI